MSMTSGPGKQTTNDGASEGGRRAGRSPQPEAYPCSPDRGILSEGPRWDAERHELLWVDVLAGLLHRSRVGAGDLLDEVVTTRFSCHLGAAAPTVSGGYVLAAGAGFLHLDEHGAVHQLAQPEAGRTDVRMNDGACDPQGRFWAGTMAYDESPEAGVLYRLELDGSCTAVVSGLTISNGIGWSPDGTTMYLADSGTSRIDAFEFDPMEGALRRRRTMVHVSEPGMVPDGLTVDDQGCVWVAMWDGACVRRYSPDGSLLASVSLPVDRPTSCAFGGPDRSTLFVTTASQGLPPAALSEQPDAGRVFRIDHLDVTGPPCFPYRGRLDPT
jgi:sugar lactone lactonase YvrE